MSEWHRKTLEILADPDSWDGDPMTHDATLLGHDTPFELACEALAEDSDRIPVSIRGESDDLILISGEIAGADEYNATKAVFTVAGMRITARFTDDGVWEISLGGIEEEVTVEATNVRMEFEGRSPTLMFDAPRGSYVTKVASS